MRSRRSAKATEPSMKAIAPMCRAGFPDSLREPSNRFPDLSLHPAVTSPSSRACACLNGTTKIRAECATVDIGGGYDSKQAKVGPRENWMTRDHAGRDVPVRGVVFY